MSDNIRDLDIFKSSERQRAKDRVLSNLYGVRPDKKERDNMLNQARLNSQLKIDVEVDVSGIEDREELKGHIGRGLRDCKSYYDRCRSHNNELDERIRALEKLKQVNSVRALFIQELIEKKEYVQHSGFIIECIQEYEEGLVEKTNDNVGVDEFIYDIENDFENDIDGVSMNNIDNGVSGFTSFGELSS